MNILKNTSGHKGRIWIIPLLFFFLNCYDVRINHSLSIENKSNRTISTLYSNSTTPDENENNIAFYVSDQNLLKPDSIRDLTILGGKDAWHDYIQRGQTKTLLLYVFDTDTLKKYDGIYSINDLRASGKYLKLFKYSENDLNKIDWKIQFRN